MATSAGNLQDVEHDYADGDSGLGSEIGSDMTTLRSSIMRHRQELGRTYHKFRADSTQYWGPNDERQNNQLDLGHHMLTLLLDNKLYLAPIDEQCQKVIDLGCGTGVWTMDFADAHPAADVIGVDLSPIQPTWTPPNCQFIIDDVEDTWAFNGGFDFVHIRCLFGSVANWPALYRQILGKLKPGGWVQQLEMSIEFVSDDGSVAEGHFMQEWSKTFLQYGEKVGKTVRIADECGQLIREAGFENVEERWYKLPVGPWPKNPKLKELGVWNFYYCMEGCEGWALHALIKGHGWSMEEAQVFIAKFKDELRNMQNHAYYRVVVVWGQKPLK